MNNNDFKYIIKRIIIGVIVGLILFNIKSCNVFAMTVFRTTIDPNTVRAYPNSNVSSGMVDITNTKSIYYVGGAQFNRYTTTYENVQYNYTISNSNFTVPGVYDIEFELYSNEHTSNVVLWNGANQHFACDISNVEYVDVINSTNYNGVAIGVQVVSCKNVYFNQISGLSINTYSNYNSGSSGTLSTNYAISRYLTFTKYDSVSEAIQEQTEQQHEDAENTQNAINDVNDSITNNNINGSIVEFNGIQIQQSATISALVAIPPYFYGKFRESLNTSCPNFVLDHMPFENLIDYSKSNLDLKCMRYYMYELLGENIYEWIGVLAGGCLLFVFLLRLGKGFVRMFSLQNNDDELWGGLS